MPLHSSHTLNPEHPAQAQLRLSDRLSSPDHACGVREQRESATQAERQELAGLEHGGHKVRKLTLSARV